MRIRNEMLGRASIAVVLVASLASFSAAQNLWVDFNSLSQDNGPHPHPDYQPYDAGHEVLDDFVTAEYPAFDGTVSFTPSWPDTTDNRTMQMIDRGTQSGEDEDGFPIVAGNDANWLLGDVDLLKDIGSLDLVTDWIGVDTRTANGGNGDYDGDVGTPSRILFTLSGVPAGNYDWTSFHHDTENIHTEFLFDYSVDGGNTFMPVGEGQFKMTNTSPGSNPPEPEVYDGVALDAFEALPLTDLPSTVQFSFDAIGQDVVMQFTPLAATAVHTQIFGVNGFELNQNSVSEPVGCAPLNDLAGDLDGDATVGFPDFLTLSANFGQAVSSYSDGDVDCDGSVGFPDFLALSANFGKSLGSTQAVPEPASWMLAVYPLIGLGLLRRRKRA